MSSFESVFLGSTLTEQLQRAKETAARQAAAIQQSFTPSTIIPAQKREVRTEGPAQIFIGPVAPSATIVSIAEPDESYTGTRMSAEQKTYLSSAIENAMAFSDRTITANSKAIQYHPDLYKLQSAIDSARKTGDMSPAMKIFITSLTDVRDMLSSYTRSGILNDANLQKVADGIELTNVLRERIRAAFPEGIPVDDAAKADQIKIEIQSLVGQIQSIRNQQYQQAIEARAAAEQTVQDYHDYTSANSAPAANASNFLPPTGGYIPPQPSVEDLTPYAVTEKTGMQKYGPVAALVAGGLAAYLALR